MKKAAASPVFTVRQWIRLGKQIGVLRTGKKRKRIVRDEISGILPGMDVIMRARKELQEAPLYPEDGPLFPMPPLPTGVNLYAKEDKT
jgi:hypothetical protein